MVVFWFSKFRWQLQGQTLHFANSTKLLGGHEIPRLWQFGAIFTCIGTVRSHFETCIEYADTVRISSKSSSRTCNFVRDARMSHGQTGSGQSQRTVYTTRNGHKRAPALPFREDEPSQVKKKSRKMQAWFSYCFLRRAFFSSSYIHFSYQEQYLWNHLEQGAGCTAQKQTWPTIPKAKIVQPPTWAASNFSPHHVEIQPFTEGLNSIG